MNRTSWVLLALSCAAALSACANKPQRMSEQECMARAMYFESNRSSEEGMIAVGTVVMNRVNSPEFPGTVCEVVGQKNQFAPGVLSKPMERGRELAFASAAKVMRGARHGEVGRRSMFFHTAGYSYPYNNMHYVAIAGGNAFYEKRRDAHVSQDEVRARQSTRSAGSQVAATTRPAAASPAALAPSRIDRSTPPLPAVSPGLPAMTIEDVLRSNGAL